MCLRLRNSHAQDNPCVVWRDAASVRACSRLRRRDLDSEGDNERSLFEQRPRPQLEAKAQVSRRRSPSEPRNNEGVLRVRSGGGAPRILANKRHRPEDGAWAVVVGAHARGCRRVLTRAPSGRGVVTPHLAQQAGVLPRCQRQHNRKESGSKHVILATPNGKTRTNQQRQGIFENADVFTRLPPPDRGICGILPVGAENSPVRLRSSITVGS